MFACRLPRLYRVCLLPFTWLPHTGSARRCWIPVLVCVSSPYMQLLPLLPVFLLPAYVWFFFCAVLPGFSLAGFTVFAWMLPPHTVSSILTSYCIALPSHATLSFLLVRAWNVCYWPRRKVTVWDCFVAIHRSVLRCVCCTAFALRWRSCRYAVTLFASSALVPRCCGFLLPATCLLFLPTVLPVAWFVLVPDVTAIRCWWSSRCCYRVLAFRFGLLTCTDTWTRFHYLPAFCLSVFERFFAVTFSTTVVPSSNTIVSVTCCLAFLICYVGSTLPAFLRLPLRLFSRSLFGWGGILPILRASRLRCRWSVAAFVLAVLHLIVTFYDSVTAFTCLRGIASSAFSPFSAVSGFMFVRSRLAVRVPAAVPFWMLPLPRCVLFFTGFWSSAGAGTLPWCHSTRYYVLRLPVAALRATAASRGLPC